MNGIINPNFYFWLKWKNMVSERIISKPGFFLQNRSCPWLQEKTLTSGVDYKGWTRKELENKRGISKQTFQFLLKVIDSHWLDKAMW